MDSKDINKEIKKSIFPLLKNNNFTIFTNRSAWRYYSDKIIHVINFQSYNSYNSSIIGCTTFSFSVNLGIYYLPIITDMKIKDKNNKLVPDEYQCHLRNRLKRSFEQFTDNNIKEPFKHYDIWFIDNNGIYLEKSINDVVLQLKNFSFQWFDKYSILENVYNLTTLKIKPIDGTWGYGNPNKMSPCSNLFSGFLAKELNKNDESKNYLQEVINSGCYKSITKELEKIVVEK